MSFANIGWQMNTDDGPSQCACAIVFLSQHTFDHRAADIANTIAGLFGSREGIRIEI